MTTIDQIRPQDHVRVSGLIKDATPMSISGTPACRYTVADGTGELDLLFLGRVAVGGLAEERSVVAEGRAVLRDGRLVIWNPWYQILP